MTMSECDPKGDEGFVHGTHLKLFVPGLIQLRDRILLGTTCGN